MPSVSWRSLRSHILRAAWCLILLATSIGIFIHHTTAMTFWFCLFPTLNYLLFGRRSGAALSAIVFVLMVGIALFPAVHLFSPERLTSNESHTIAIWHVGGLYICLWLLTHRYEINHQRSEQILENMATRDALTGLLNRHALQRDVKPPYNLVCHSTHCRTQSENVTSGSLLLLDLDYFKQINDRYGHHAGDAVLIQTAQLLQRLLPNHAIYRIGGEEFCILLNGMTKEGALGVAESLRIQLAQHHFHAINHQIQLTASIGVGELQPKHSLEQALYVADDALYLAKQNGRDQVYLGTSTTASSYLLMTSALKRVPDK